MTSFDRTRGPLWQFALLGLVLLAGLWLRLPTAEDATIAGFDEAMYQRYVTAVRDHGPGIFPALCAEYVDAQAKAPAAFLPPTRVLFLTSAGMVSQTTGLPPREAVRWVSSAAASVILLLAALIAWRLGGLTASIAVAVLMACAPTQLHMSHRALIDGFFGLLALTTAWALWENLRAPNSRRWLSLYGVGLAAMVLTKENAFFVFVAVCGLLALNRWLKLGKVTRALLVVTFAAPALGALLLIVAAGGPHTLIEVFRLNVEKSAVLPYAIATGDGPWFRYLSDLLMVNPIVLLLAIGAALAWRGDEPAAKFWALFILLSYAIMCQVRYGINLRYGNMWDFALCWLAFTQLRALSARASLRWQPIALTLAVGFVAVSELHQYNRLFSDARIYDPVPAALSQALEMIKPTAPE